ncbi:MAG: helix-turn-helix domain-containing protein [Bacillota bacterium]
MEEQRALQIHNCLVQGVLGGSGIEGISIILASLVESTVVIEDRYFNMIVASVPRGNEIKTGIFPEWATPKEFLNLRDVQQLLEQVKRTKRSTPVPAYPHIGLQIPSLIAPIIIRNEILGYVSIYRRSNQEFSELDFMACEQAAIVVALEMLRERTATEVEERIKGDFFDDLFSNRFENEESIKKRGRHLGYNLMNTSRVLVLQPHNLLKIKEIHEYEDEYAILYKLTNRISDSLQIRSQERLIGTRSGAIVLLLPVSLERCNNKVQDLAGILQSSIKSKFPDLVISIGIGACCQRLEDYKHSYDTARKCIEFIEKQNHQGAVMFFEDSGVNRLIFSVENSELVFDFINKTLGPLVDYDKNNNMELLGTLAIFLGNQFSQQKTAEDCFVHISTLRYRLQRVEEILGIDLHSSEQTLNLYVAIKAYETLMQCTLTLGKVESRTRSGEDKKSGIASEKYSVSNYLRKV